MEPTHPGTPSNPALAGASSCRRRAGRHETGAVGSGASSSNGIDPPGGPLMRPMYLMYLRCNAPGTSPKHGHRRRSRAGHTSSAAGTVRSELSRDAGRIGPDRWPVRATGTAQGRVPTARSGREPDRTEPAPAPYPPRRGRAGRPAGDGRHGTGPLATRRDRAGGRTACRFGERPTEVRRNLRRGILEVDNRTAYEGMTTAAGGWLVDARV
jgi:hypothetical protein